MTLEDSIKKLESDVKGLEGSILNKVIEHKIELMDRYLNQEWEEYNTFKVHYARYLTSMLLAHKKPEYVTGGW